MKSSRRARARRAADSVVLYPGRAPGNASQRRASVRARQPYTLPAVVLGMGLNGLGVVRSLARAGVPVVAVDDDAQRPAMRTRYGRKLIVRALSGDALVDDLVAFGRTFAERPVLFLTEEATVRTVSERRGELLPYYRITLADAGVMAALMHKEGFRRIAQAHGFRLPRSLHVTDADTLAAAGALRYPAVLKPGGRNADYGRSFKKAYRVTNYEQAAMLCRRIMPVLPDLVLQEWIAGADADIYFCLQYIRADGTPAASFTGRKIRSWPPEVGGTASCVGAPEAAVQIEAETTRFFRASGFVGMGSMEYKHDRERGELYLVEPTVGRTDYQEEVATLNGVNIPLAAYCAEAGLPVPRREMTPGRRVWRESATDRWSAALQNEVCGRGPLDAGARTDAWRRWYDPAPWLAKESSRLFRAVRRRVRLPGKPAEQGQ